MTFRSWNERGRAVRAERTDRRDRMARHTAARAAHTALMRIVSADEAVAGIGSGQQVYVHCAAATPSVLLDALVAPRRRARATSASSTSTSRARARTWRPRWRPHFRHRALFIGPNARAAVNEGRADYVPVFLSDVPGCSRAARCRSTPCSSTPRRPTPTASARSARASRRCTPRSAPRRRSSSSSTARCRGRSATASSTSTTSTSRSRSTCRRTSSTPTRSATSSGGSASYVADLVPDGATLQLGIGAIPAATALALRDKRDLGIHTEMFTDAVVDLVEAGVVTGRAQGAQPRQDRDGVPDGHASACTTSSTTTRWSRCARSTSRTTPTSSARSAGWSRSTRRSRST